MSRPMGLGLVLAVMLLMIGESAYAQMPASMSGGFGFDYAQPLPSNTYLLDRWWMVQPTPMVGGSLPPQSVVRAPVAVQPVNPRRARRAARMSRTYAQPYTRSVVQPMTALPTGSLYWPGAAGVPIYSPTQRYITYGQGYGISPYGSADYGAQYKGMYWGR